MFTGARCQEVPNIKMCRAPAPDHQSSPQTLQLFFTVNIPYRLHLEPAAARPTMHRSPPCMPQICMRIGAQLRQSAIMNDDPTF